jgi:hyperosmotically inducible protein
MRSLVFLLFAITLAGCSGLMLGGGSGSGSSGSGGTGTSQSSGSTQPSDIAITGMVREAFSGDPRVSTSPISVSTRQGMVELAGTARGYEARETAEKLAMAVDGVKGVDNRIAVE